MGGADPVLVEYLAIVGRQAMEIGAIPGRGAHLDAGQRLDGFYVVTSNSAVTLGPLWGRIVAAELLDGVADPRLAPYRPARFLR